MQDKITHTWAAVRNVQAEAQKLQQEQKAKRAQREQRVCVGFESTDRDRLGGDGDLRGPRVQRSGAEDTDGARSFRGLSGGCMGFGHGWLSRILIGPRLRERKIRCCLRLQECAVCRCSILRHHVSRFVRSFRIVFKHFRATVQRMGKRYDGKQRSSPCTADCMIGLPGTLLSLWGSPLVAQLPHSASTLTVHPLSVSLAQAHEPRPSSCWHLRFRTVSSLSELVGPW